MKILYISQYFPPEMGAPSARVSELSRHWSNMGHQVTVLTGFPNHPTGTVHTGYRSKIKRGIYTENFNGVRVIRSWLFPLPNRKPLERILNYTSFFLSAALVGSFVSKPDVVIATSPQLLVGLAGWWLKFLRNIPFVLEIRDLWPESITQSGVGSEKSLLARTLTALSDFLYRRCSHLGVVTPAFKTDIIQKYRIHAEKISIVVNGVETGLFSPNHPNTSFKNDIGLQNKFLVSYIGTMGLAHGLNTVIEAAAILRRRFPDILFAFIGEGANKAALIESAKKQNLPNLLFISQKPRNKMPAFISASDACLVLLKKRPVFKTVIPTKMLEFMSCAKPVILGVDGQARQILEDARGGIFIEPENAEALAESVVRLYQNEGLRETLGQNGRQYIIAKMSRKSTAVSYLEILQSVINDPR